MFTFFFKYKFYRVQKSPFYILENNTSVRYVFLKTFYKNNILENILNF